jgi:hypothetical protein
VHVGMKKSPLAETGLHLSLEDRRNRTAGIMPQSKNW